MPPSSPPFPILLLFPIGLIATLSLTLISFISDPISITIPDISCPSGIGSFWGPINPPDDK